MIRIYATAILTALLMLTLAYGLHSISVQRLEKKHAKQMVQLATLKDGACTLAKQITNGVSHDLQNDLSGLDADADLADNSLRHANGCAIVTGITATGHDAATTGQKSAGGNDGSLGVEARKLISIAKKGERYRLQLKACQRFITVTQQNAPK